MRRDVVFMHIPKTGGTSLRVSLEQALKNHLILHDYGDEPETTPELYELVYEQGRLSAFRDRLNDKERGILLTGHFPTVEGNRSAPRGAARYWDFFNAESFMTFLRHPVDRIYSEYAHFVNLRGWTAGFEEFVAGDRGKQRCRRMSMLLSGVDLDRFGFIGFMEEFEESFAALGGYLGATLPWKQVNVGNYRTLDPAVLENERYRAMVTELSRDDIALYEKFHAARSGTYIAPAPDASVAKDYIGQVRLNGDHAVGWLCNKACEFIASVDVISEGRTIATTPADRFRKRPRDKGHSRTGVCGFEVDVRSFGRAGAGNTLSFRAHGNDYELSGSPLTIRTD